MNTKRARSDVRPQPTQVSLIRTLVSTASNVSADAQVGRTLFSLLVPRDLEPFMGSSTETVLELEEATAGIPWEILETPRSSSGDDPPWSIRTKLLRKLRMSVPNEAAPDATAEDSILVIGDPACNRNRYPILLGARREAAEVVSCLSPAIEAAEGERRSTAVVFPVISGSRVGGGEPDANVVINAMMRQPWRIIHIAAHGEPPLQADGRTDPRGVVLSGDAFLGPNEIAALPVTPELVFVNCCHLAASSATLLGETNYDRARFASGVAQALIKGGVRCVVAAGWAVDDEAASVFARTFYQKLLRGDRFIDAVSAARTDARALGGNTWAAYQCYGDPDWRFRRGPGDAQRPTPMPAGQEFASIASAPALIDALERIAVESETQRADRTRQVDRLRFLEAAHAPAWGHLGNVAEAFGKAWAGAGILEDAVRWYERARAAQDGSASFAAIEQLVKVRLQAAWNRVEDAGRSAPAIETARKGIADALRLLDGVSALGQTFERENLYGSVYKHVALLEAEAGREHAATQAIERMREHFGAAEAIARDAAGGGDASRQPLFHAAMNRIAAQLALAGARKRNDAMDDETLKAIRSSMSSATPDFGSIVGQTELDMYAAVARGSLANDLLELVRKFTEHHTEVRAPGMWASVLDDARFVLAAYQRTATSAESDAADHLLAHLRTLAGREASSSPATRPARQSRRTAASRRAVGKRHAKKR